MRQVHLFFAILIALCVRAQVNETFSDGNFTFSPTWSGQVDNFTVNSSLQLQSKATTTSVSWLSTPSQSINDASWHCNVKISYPTSSSNYSCFYIISDTENISELNNGYYVQIGGTADEVSLFYQKDKVKTKIIDGIDKRSDGNTVDMTVKVLRDSFGNFKLFSKKNTETDFVFEGECFHLGQASSSYIGVLYSNTMTTGSAYVFDDILVTGNVQIDTIRPELQKFELVSDRKIRIFFSEKISIQQAQFSADNGLDAPLEVKLDQSSREVELEFSKTFQKATLYLLSISNVFDLADNLCNSTNIHFGVIEPVEPGDVVINEIMFDAPSNGQEFVELINISDKLLDASHLSISTRKADGNIQTGLKSIDKLLMLPRQAIAWALNPDSVRKYHNAPIDATILSTDKWSALNNESSSLVISSLITDSVLDELCYSVKWHHVLLSETKGISLERISPNAPTQDKNNWHSSASEVNYGTPGYQNSQFYANLDNPRSNIVWLEPEIFSPNNDGINDICFIRYSTEYSGFVSNIRVFNPSGILLASPIRNALLSTDGFLNWDGKTDKGLVVESGIYMLYFEMFNPESGKKVEKTMPLVVSGR